MANFNGSSIPLNAAFGGLPQVGGALPGWSIPMVFGVVTKTRVNNKIVETMTNISTQGVWQPMSNQELKLKEEGQRGWAWYTVHALPSLILDLDSVVNYQGTQYRVMMKKNYKEYGYVEYQLVNDYTGAGPTVVTP